VEQTAMSVPPPNGSMAHAIWPNADIQAAMIKETPTHPVVLLKNHKPYAWELLIK